MPRPSSLRRDLHGRREAGVEVDVGEVISVDPGQRQGLAARQAHGRRRAEVVALGEVVVVVRVRAAVREHPAIAGHAERLGPLGGAEDHGRALLHGVVRVHPLRVREPDHPVVGAGGADLLGAVGLLDPGVRVGAGHLAEAGPELGHRHEVLVEPPPDVDAVGLLEQRIHLHRHEHPARLLAGRGHRDLRRRAGRLGDVVTLHRPVEGHAGGSGGRAGAPRLGAAEEDEVGLAALDRQAGHVDERLRAVAAHPRHGAGARRRADPRRDEEPRIAIAPGEQPHDVDGVGAGQRRCARPAVVRGAPQRLGDQVDRLDRGGPLVDTIAQLTGTDQDRCAGVDHGLLRHPRELD